MRENKQNKTAWLLVNVGTPDKPSSPAVRKYLREFLDDPKVIDLPFLLRKFLVHLIIVPFRAPRSSKKYRQIWTSVGSPLLDHMNQLVEKTRTIAPEGTDVFGLMRYGQPSLREFLGTLPGKGYKNVILLPLYPQYADSTTGSVEELVTSTLSGSFRFSRQRDHNFAGKDSAPRTITGRGVSEIRIIDQFYNHPGFIASFKGRILEHDLSAFDHVLFSYHGLPIRQLQKIHPAESVAGCNCQLIVPTHGHHCYRAICYETTRRLASAAGIDPSRCSTSFQSRLSRNWMTPFTDKTLVRLAAEGKKRVLVVPASFVADCLETTLEIGLENRELFLKHGGEELEVTKSLNSNDLWVKTVNNLIQESQQEPIVSL